jgi:HAE1 family hydrophobic/amphiphilic exporter-1
MRFAHFFVDRPVFATVLSIVVMIVGALGYAVLPVARYPGIVPPNIYVSASYPGASADTVAKTVAAVLERELNGVEDMLYMSSTSKEGSASIALTFRVGINLDNANTKVQERIAVALPKLPQEVRAAGVTSVKRSGNFTLVVNLVSPDSSRDQMYLSNYAQLNIRDQLMRIDGVASVDISAAREYALRVWLNPDKLAAYSLTTVDVMAAMREQNVEVAAGSIGDDALKLGIRTQGRLSNPREFQQIIVKAVPGGRLVRLGDVATVEMAPNDDGTSAYVDGQPAVALAIFSRPDANTLKISEEATESMVELARSFPAGVGYSIGFNPTKIVRETANKVYQTLIEALLLVILVVVIFLQSWRTVVIPVVAIPISLIGTFALMAVCGFSLNNLTLLGLVLAIGIVVDDAIVFVENVERNIATGLSPRDASRKTVDEAGTAIIAIALVLLAVFIPTAFMPGITGQFYRQFALTIAASTVISTFVSLTLTPAMCAALLKPHGEATGPAALPLRLSRRAGELFDRSFVAVALAYARAIGRVASGRRLISLGLIIYAGLAAGTVTMTQLVPTGFIPKQDAGWLYVYIELPQGASLARTDVVAKRVAELGRATPGVAEVDVFTWAGGATLYLPLRPFPERVASGLTANSIKVALEEKTKLIQEAEVTVSTPSAIPGLGVSGAFKIMLQDRGSLGNEALRSAARDLVARVNEQHSDIFEKASAPDSVNAPQVYVDIDRTRASMLGVPLASIFSALQVNLGGAYVNDFNAFGRAYQVKAQAAGPFREDRSRILKLKVRSATGELISLGSLITIRDIAGSPSIDRHNLFNALAVSVSTRPGVSSATGLALMEQIARDTLPSGIGYEWTELAFQEKAASGGGMLVFALSVLFVFLVLAALYESWVLPLAIVLIVPLCVLSALAGTSIRGMENNILTQVGMVLLIALASKNAILIVEFARQAEEQGMARVAAVVQAAQMRLRPIIMTTLAFVLGVLPLLVSRGAGAELRQALGTAVFSGMIGVTLFGLFLTPIFYVAIRNAADWLKRSKKSRSQPNPFSVPAE